MHRRCLIFIIARWILLVLPVSSDDLFSFSNSDDLLWDPNSTLEFEVSTAAQPSVDDLDSDLELTNFDDFVDRTFFEDDGSDLFANTASHSLCAAAEAGDITLEARDGKSSCQTVQKESSPILSPESVQLFQDPITVLSNPSNKKQRPSGSSEPPNPSEPPVYPGLLPDEEASERNEGDLKWDLEALGLSLRDNTFFCLYKRKVPVCCDGPYQAYGVLQGCDACKFS